MATRILGAALMAALAAAAVEIPSRDGLRVWLDAATPGSLLRGADGQLGQWQNRVPGGPAAVAEANSAPAVVEKGMNGKPVIRFTGTQWLRLPALRKQTGPVAVFVVAQRLAGQTSDTKWQRIVSCWDGQRTDDNKPPDFSLVGGKKGTGKPFEPMVFDVIRNDVGLHPIWLGRNGKHEGQNFHGDIAEVLVYDRGFLSEDAIQNVLRYLGEKWGARVLRQDKGWTLVGPLKDIPKRVSDELPLSDQTNQGKWTPYPALTDEFKVETLDPEKWWPTNPKWAGRQPALFHASNVKVADGELQLTMRKWFPPEGTKRKGYHTYTSAAVQSKERVLYGYYEIEAIPMRSHGSSAFWFYDSTKTIWTEIDVFEIGGGAPKFERKYNMNAHVFHTPKERRHWNIGGTWVAPADLADGYHVYGLEWSKAELKYYVDGVLVRRMKNTHWHQPLTLNFDSETMPNWFGLPRDQDLPSTFRIRYVRAWQQPQP